MKSQRLSLGKLTIGWLAFVASGGVVAMSSAQETTFYYAKGERVPLTVDATKSFVLFSPDTTATEVKEAAKSAQSVMMRFEDVRMPATLNLTHDALPEQPKWAIIRHDDLAAQPLAQGELAKHVAYSAPFFRTKEDRQVGMSHLVYVKLKDGGDKEKLEAMAKELRVEVVGNNKQLPLWYTLACTNQSVGNALEVANRLYESKHFAAAEPDFLADFQIKCAQEAHFSKQWGLKNSGQNGGSSGVDIGICDAWKVATGKGVKVAVVDHGIQLDHPDLKANISTLSFDAVTGRSPSRVRGNHGTACAGIIAAIRNNGVGVVGVAPDATLISVSHTLAGVGPNQQQELASGIAWASQNGADVISNSWGHDLLESALIDDAIEEAITNGRGGKGCVVAFAAGNNDDAVIYPARSNPAVLAVAAMSPCGERKSRTSCDPETWWGSCFGNSLDIAAPGIMIPTTDLTGENGYDSGDYTMTFNGTSSATPHVAGVAALVLEINPNLRHDEVVAIIEKCGRKVGPYSYQITAGRVNGDWHEEMGYGLLDAGASVKAAEDTLASE